MEEVEGNEEDNHIGLGFFDTYDDEGGNLPDDSYKYTEEDDNSSIDGANEEDDDEVVDESQVAIGGKAQNGQAANQSDKESNGGEPADDTFDDTFIPHMYPSSLKIFEEEGPSTKEGENETIDKQVPQDHVMEPIQESHDEHNLKYQHKHAEEELEVEELKQLVQTSSTTLKQEFETMVKLQVAQGSGGSVEQTGPGSALATLGDMKEGSAEHNS
ncbi:hypothetical protein Scep_007638 [Stephania cephalantha]|uniref:Uncharacterized protein n=1 Tax=Stephania cephalantha TaxID=152367 RepID=A0AAP0KA96_9MAGN